MHISCRRSFRPQMQLHLRPAVAPLNRRRPHSGVTCQLRPRGAGNHPGWWTMPCSTVSHAGWGSLPGGAQPPANV